MSTRNVPLVALLVAAGLALPASAGAAQFTTTPYNGQAFTSGTGPFGWSFQSGQSQNGEYGWVAYKLSTESSWHRCLRYANVQLAGLSPGTYSIQIGDDLNMDWLSSHGLLESGQNTCGIDEPPPSAVSMDSFAVVPPAPPPVVPISPQPTGPVPIAPISAAPLPPVVAPKHPAKKKHHKKKHHHRARHKAKHHGLIIR